MMPKPKPELLDSTADKLYAKVGGRFVCYYDHCPYMLYKETTRPVCPFRDCIYHVRVQPLDNEPKP